MRAYGWDTDGEIIEAEAEQIRAMRRYFAEGGSFRGLSRKLTDEGVATATGRTTWSASVLRNLLTNPRLAALKRLPDGSHIEAPGRKPILQRGEWESLQNDIARTFREGSTGQVRPGSPHLLDGTLRCGSCGTVMASSGDGSGRRTYRCLISAGGCGKVRIDQKMVDTEVEQVVLEQLINPDTRKALVDGYTVGKSRKRRATEEELDERAAEVGRQYAAGAIDVETLKAATAAIREDRANLEKLAQVESLPSPSVRAVAEWWSGLSPDRRHAAVRLVIDHITVAPTGPGRRRTVMPRLDIHWRV